MGFFFQKKVKSDPSPIMLMKAIKNQAERDGMKASHVS